MPVGRLSDGFDGGTRLLRSVHSGWTIHASQARR